MHVYMYVDYTHASMISEKRNTEYNQTLNWIWCKLCFALLRASVMSIRGARSSRHHAASEATQDLQLMEGQLHGVANLLLHHYHYYILHAHVHMYIHACALSRYVHVCV